MKILAVDVGNSEVKRVSIDDGAIGIVQRNATRDIDNFVDEIAKQDLPVVLCSVRSAVTSRIKEALARENKELNYEITDANANPVSGFYKGIGGDRIAEVSAAWLEFGGNRPVAVIGLGTATTISAASSEGEFKGGFITLGLGAVCSTLSNALPELPTIDPREARSLEPAFDTYSNLCRGAVAAHVGIVKEWISLFKKDLGDDLAVLATGGWSEFVSARCDCFDKVDPLLTLKGIWAVYKASNRPQGG